MLWLFWCVGERIPPRCGVVPLGVVVSRCGRCSGFPLVDVGRVCRWAWVCLAGGAVRLGGVTVGRSVGVAVVLAVVLMVSGCSGGDVLEPEPGSEAAAEAVAESFSESDSELESVPEMVSESGAEGPTPYPEDVLPERLSDLVSEPVFPELAHEYSPEGAAAFVTYVMDAAIWLYAGGDGSFLTAVCSDSAGFCQSVSDTAAELMSEETVRFGALNHLDITSVTWHPEENASYVFADFSSDPGIDLDPDGVLVREFGVKEYPVVFHVIYRDDAWVLEAAGSE